MKKTATTILLLAVFFIVSYWPHWSSPVPCAEPIAYSIGTFDKRFGLNQADFLSALAQAEIIWESPSGRELFVHSPEEAELPINLIYDYRQEVTLELGEIESEVERSEDAYNNLEARYEQVRREYNELKSLYESRVAALDSRNTAYDSEVREWNNGPRNSKKEFDALERERLAINADVENLRNLEATFNSKVRELNQLVDRLNRLARELNLNVSEYNTIGAQRGETFEGGVYYSDSDGAGINIYEFSTRAKLVRVLAHELGHALGLDHIADENAIMYELNKSTAGKATTADLAALEALCAEAD